MKKQSISPLLITAILVIIIAFAGPASADVTPTAVVNATIEGTVAITQSTQIGSDAYCMLTNTTTGLLPGGTGNTEADDEVVNDYIVIENSGDLFLDIAAYSNANLFTGGAIQTASNQEVQAVEGETGSIKTIDATTYTALGVSASSKTAICQGLDWDDSSDLLFIHIKLTVPKDASATTYMNTIMVVVAADTTSGTNDAV